MRQLLKYTTFLLLSCTLLYVSCKKEYSCENCRESNKPPVANAGKDTSIILPADSIKLDGSRSTDPDDGIVGFKWVKIAGPDTLNISSSLSAKTIVNKLVKAVYLFQLTVTDKGGLSAKDTVQVTVYPAGTTNRPPIANAGRDTTIVLPANTVTLDGSGSSDPDNNISSYTWAKISGPLSYNIADANISQTPVTNLAPGVYLFELKVTDAAGLFSKDTIQVTVSSNTSNLPPVAHAGSDISVNYDLQTCSINPSSFSLNGTASVDPDGTIVSYLWTGPGTIINPAAAITQVSNLNMGVYEFILKVTDNMGATGMDTVFVNSVSLMNRPLVPAQLTSIGSLSETRPGFAVAAAGNKILFAGGANSITSQNCITNRVDIYDITSGTWSITQLPTARSSAGTAVLGNKIFFAGGVVPLINPLTNGCYTTNWNNTRTSAIDIYDVSSNTWSSAQLSSARCPVGSSASNKVVFAGGDDDYIQRVNDIYDAGTNTWSTTMLSEARHIMQPAVAGNKIYFGGGSVGLYTVSGGNLSKQIDIYDAITNTWTNDTLSRIRGEMGAISANNKIYWGGGYVWDQASNNWEGTNSVEIRNLANNTTSFDCLSEPRTQVIAIRKDNKLIYFGANQTRFDIYDLTTNSWSIGVMPVNITSAAIIAVNNIIYVAGGMVNGTLSNQVWKLNF
ncbi:MAG: PKD domain-containing protein [Bacteroidota bacterium]